MNREFAELFRKLCKAQSPWTVWNDFIRASTISLDTACRNMLGMEPADEKEYETILSRYENGAEDFSAMLACMAESLEENPRQDFLGDTFMRLGLGDSWKGQMFTPYSLCEAMARNVITRESVQQRIDERGWATVSDVACGAGATLIAARNVCQDFGFGGEQVFFVAQDISPIAADMCWLQLSLLGCAGYVCTGNSLAGMVLADADGLWPLETDEYRIMRTPMWYSDTWQMRMFLHRKAAGHD